MKGNVVVFLVTQQHVVDSLGMSLVHTNKTFQRLRRSSAASWHRNQLEVTDAEALAGIARYAVPERNIRPFI